MRIPQGLDVAALLPGESRTYHAPALWFIHKLTVGPLYDARTRKERRGWHPVKWEDMNPLFGADGAWSRVRRQLIAAGVVECDEEYRPGEKAKYYRLAPKWRDRDTERRPITDKKLIRRLSAHEETLEEVAEALRPVIEWLQDNFGELTIVEAETRRYTSNPRSLGHWLNRLTIAAIQAGEWRLTMCDYHRLHSVLTNMKRKLRSALRWHGIKPTEIDVKSAQPLIVGAMTSAWAKGMTSIEVIREAGRKVDRKVKGRSLRSRQQRPTLCQPISRLDANPTACLIPPGSLDDPCADLRDYMEVCESGRFYEVLAAMWGLDIRDDVQKNTIKRAAFRYVFFGPTRPNNLKWQAFKERWPTVAAFLESSKAPDGRIEDPSRADRKRAYGTPARASQRIEADLMIGGVANRLMHEQPGVPIWTIHDAILVAPHASEAVRLTILDVFASHGLHPQVEVKG